MRLEIDKQYILRNGYITGSMFWNDTSNLWPYTDGTLMWSANGMFCQDPDSKLTVVAEYISPEPKEPLRWATNTIPNKRGIWARLNSWGISVQGVTDKDFDLPMVPGTYCYLGPVPEILPERNIIQRLWLEPVANGIEPQTALHKMHWIADDHKLPAPPNWIKTANTREVRDDHGKQEATTCSDTTKCPNQPATATEEK